MYVLLFVAVATVIVIGPQTQNITVGQSFMLTCNATGYPVPNIKWTQNGISRNSLSSYYNITVTEGLQSNASVITITNAMTSDTGIYQCIATNIVNNNTQDATVTVKS